MPKASFSVVILEEAETDMRAVPFPFRRQLNQRVFRLKDDPRPADSRVVSGEIRILRLDRWGLVYLVDDQKLTLTLLGVPDFGPTLGDT